MFTIITIFSLAGPPKRPVVPVNPCSNPVKCQSYVRQPPRPATQRMGRGKR